MLKVQNIMFKRFTSDEKVTVSDVCLSTIIEEEQEEAFVKKTSIEGVYSYGLKQLKDGIEHKAGYVWASRCGVMNMLFGTKLLEVSINGRCYGMDIDVFKALLEEQTGDKYEVQQYYQPYDKKHEEPNYQLIKVEVQE